VVEQDYFMDQYKPKNIEPKWQKYWEKHPELFASRDDSPCGMPRSGILPWRDIPQGKDKEKKYILDMFPYPSGDGLHAGHVESYTATDIISRYLRMKGKNVLHPQGWDAFGLPAENYAIKTKVHPSITTQKAISAFKRQMKALGLSYDWSREIDSSNPDYYKWTQWFFLLLYKNGLAYRAKAKVNFCPRCQTVLANEQVIYGKCERCETEVIQKDLEQWFFKITDFIEDNGETRGLISGLDKVDWPEATKTAQLNWIGKSEGSEVNFMLKGLKEKVPVYTTRIDTIFSGTYLILAPEHELVGKITTAEHRKEIEEYVTETENKTELQRIGTEGNKTGVFTGSYAVNPATGKEIPVWISDFVIGKYGTGAVFADAHDERDFEMAKKYNIPLKVSIKPEDKDLWEKVKNLEICYPEEGILVNSGQFDGLTSREARIRITRWLEKKGLARFRSNYKLRDWLVSRQRYWGAPIPIIYCDKCGAVPVLEKDLPVTLPDDVDFKPTGESPLKYSKKFQNVKCPVCGGKAVRESDTMDTFVCSSWYYFRYADPKNNKEFAAKDKIKKWLPVDVYVGGAEHTVMHLLYSRFFTKVLHYLGYISFDEPFLKLCHQGTILGENGQKMSKSRGNVVNPDDIVAEYGADALRLYEMFMGPLEDAKPWNTKGIIGVKRFLNKTWNLQYKIPNSQFPIPNKNTKYKIQNTKTDALLHKTIKKVTEDIENLKFNTAISALMILVNELGEQKSLEIGNWKLVITLLSPFAPHISEELWSRLGHKESIFREKWPKYDPELIKEERINLVIQVNGKVRDTIKVPAGISEEKIKELALESAKVRRYTSKGKIIRMIYVPGKILNIVVS
jgi:leucyl-tRNA synthetase